MNKEQVKEYIKKYNESHSKEAIKRQLQNSGARKKDIEEAFKEVSKSPQITAKKGKSGLALGLVIAGLVVPLVGWIMMIIGIILGFKARKINKNDGVALAAIIIGCVGFLLIPVIVGALMFSFVDFSGPFIPNKIELNNNLRGYPFDSFACSDSCFYNIDNSIYVAFTYIGAQPISINSNAGTINTIDGNVCQSVSIRNADTESKSETGEDIEFRNSQTGVMIFQCEKDLIKNDVLEGDIKITQTNIKTQQKTDSTGIIRLNIN